MRLQAQEVGAVAATKRCARSQQGLSRPSNWLSSGLCPHRGHLAIKGSWATKTLNKWSDWQNCAHRYSSKPRVRVGGQWRMERDQKTLGAKSAELKPVFVTTGMWKYCSEKCSNFERWCVQWRLAVKRPGWSQQVYGTACIKKTASSWQTKPLMNSPCA